MRAAPPIVVTVARFGVWRGAVAALCALAAAAFGAWAMLRLEFGVVLPVALIAAASAGALSLIVSRRGPVCLCWDGRTWALDGEPCALQPAVDAGTLMLLRLRRAAQPMRTIWLPLQRRGLEPSWHALRAAVYSPRPMIDAPSQAASND